MIAKTAKTIAALSGRTEVNRKDLVEAMELALPHRMRKKPFEKPVLPKEKIESFKNNMFGGQRPLCISAVSGENLEELKDKIAMLVNFSEKIRDR